MVLRGEEIQFHVFFPLTLKNRSYSPSVPTEWEGLKAVLKMMAMRKFPTCTKFLIT